MTRAESYVPPTSTKMAANQDSPQGLRLLLAQRRMHSKAKFWSMVRGFGVAIIAIAAPTASVIWPNTAVISGAIAGLWIFLGRTVLASLQIARSRKAAAIQEDFDILVFEMPQLPRRNPRASLEEVALLSGQDTDLAENARSQKLTAWYPIDPSIPGAESVAIAQRANASYSSRLLKLNCNLWIGCTAAWIVIATVIGILVGLKFETFLLGIFLPVLPALLDVYEQWRLTKMASLERSSLADDIETSIADNSENGVNPEDLLMWQDRIYSLRVGTPQTADILYKITRNRNEQAMSGAADQIAQSIRTNRQGRS